MLYGLYGNLKLRFIDFYSLLDLPSVTIFAHLSSRLHTHLPRLCICAPRQEISDAEVMTSRIFYYLDVGLSAVFVLALGLLF